MAVEVLSKIYKPAALVGQVYARPYGSLMLPVPIGNVLELTLEHKEEVQKQEDMTRLGGGTHAEMRRVTEATIKMKLADLNVPNLARASLGIAEGVDAGNATDEPFIVSALGTLLPLDHIDPTSVVLKKGATAGTATPVSMAANYEPRAEGIYLLETAADVAVNDKLWVSYSYGEYAVIEALTTKANELELLYGGMNEADSGKPMVVNVWRASQGVTKSLALINSKGFGALDVEGSVLKDPTKTGQGISQYYRTRVA